jgi:hypothetical protein
LAAVSPLSSATRALLRGVRASLQHPLNHPRTLPLSAAALNASAGAEAEKDEDDDEGEDDVDAHGDSESDDDDDMALDHGDDDGDDSDDDEDDEDEEESEPESRCTDRCTYLEQLFRALQTASLAALTEQRGGASFVATFLRFCRTQYALLYPRGEHAIPIAQRRRVTAVVGAKRVVMLKLHLFLRVLTAFKSLKRHDTGRASSSGSGSSSSSSSTSHGGDDDAEAGAGEGGAGALKRLLFELLARSDPALQTLALECLNKWQLAYLYPYREHVARLIAEATFREELTLFSVAPSAGQVCAPRAQNTHRMGGLSVVTLLIVCLFLACGVSCSCRILNKRSFLVLT